MKEFIQEAVLGFNLPFTVLLGFVLLYWMIALVGLMDLEFLDGVFDLSGDMDGADGEAGASSPGPLQNILRFFNATDVPIILVLSMLVLFLWFFNFVGNFYFNPADSSSLAGIILIPVLIASLLMTKLVTEPLKPFARMLKSQEHQEPLAGREGVVRSPELTSDFGQVELKTTGAPVLLNACLPAGEPPLPRGAPVLVVSLDPTGKVWIVRPLGTAIL